MQKRMFCVTVLVVFILSFSFNAFAGMGSKSFHITTSVISGGGAPMASTSFQNNSTLGQPSPLMDSNDPPYSVSYDLYPGFWYTLEAKFIEPCEGDFDRDGDVDGSDLAVFAAYFGRTDCQTGPICEGDFDSDGDVDGSDLAIFAADFGRTDCPIPQ